MTKAKEIDPRIGKRVEIAPHHDLWMQGARMGIIRKIETVGVHGGEIFTLKMDHPQVKRLARIHGADCTFR